jgi:transposase
MSSKFINADRNTLFLMPPSVQDWLPEDHLARFVVEIVSQLDLRPLKDAYAGRGSRAYNPEILLALLFYGYATGIFASRKLERATYDSVAFRYIAANTHPDHDTIATFRKRFLNELKSLFVQILLIAQQMGLLKLGKVSLDGTKVKANASKHHALSWEYACKLEVQLKDEVEELLRLAEQADSSTLPDEMSIPEELSRREERLTSIALAKAEIERRADERYAKEKEEYDKKMAERAAKEQETGKKVPGKKPKPPKPVPGKQDQVNLTDSDSRIMPTSNGFEQTYNAQAGTDIESYLIVENHISQHPNDKQEVDPTLQGLGNLPEDMGKTDALLADTGYFSETNVESCEQLDIVPYIASKREKHNQPLYERFKEPPPLPEDSSSVEKMKHRLQTREGKKVYAKRKSTIETVFGIIKHVIGFRQFLLRGLESVSGEWNLVCIAWNLKRMHALRS